jgi:hypothetical protein
VRVGVWEDDRFIGCVLFSRGACSALGKPYGLDMVEVCELTRVALALHRTPTSRIVAIALRMLRKHCPGLRLVVSFADPNEGHAGTLYQAGGWVYAGDTEPGVKFIDRRGREWHPRQVSRDGIKLLYGEVRRAPVRSECRRKKLLPKHRYLMPLDAAMREQIRGLAKPYPRGRGADGGAPAPQAGERRFEPDPSACR